MVDCGARCPAHNAAIGGAPDSAHVVGLAADLADLDGTLKSWLLTRLVDLGLWMEAPASTPTWAHVQIRPAANRVFKP